MAYPGKRQWKQQNTDMMSICWKKDISIAVMEILNVSRKIMLHVFNVDIDNNVNGVIVLSSDKAAFLANLYGATRLCASKLFVSGNENPSRHDTIFPLYCH